MTPEWVTALSRAAQRIIPADFVGKIELNVFLGGISNVGVHQSFKEGHGDMRQPTRRPQNGDVSVGSARES